ncbi:hypothetical protein FA15DRAFT_643594 [Coprinopsis marcescibilis]|uniref:Protein kinase domain-containing protein n=1 Tax=Coprinopsis marcescibilis TaxID=230819 RepID=A0A5C3KQH4_COPMA|nr:hypothetical protein FA15DRAFT_643594 [Coprinopsis marcescibilis]
MPSRNPVTVRVRRFRSVPTQTKTKTTPRSRIELSGLRLCLTPMDESLPAFRFGLEESELFWRDQYKFLLEKGYRLGSRYDPEWTPSWTLNKKLRAGLTADSIALTKEDLIDAIQVSDDQHVVLKRVNKTRYPHETKIMKYFSEGEIAKDPRNHCVPVLDVLQAPNDDGHEIVIIPVLREFDSPDFDTIGECIAFLRQLLEGFTFLHEHRVAHRDIKIENVMMDSAPLRIERFNFHFPDRTFDYTGYVEAKSTRTEHPTKYFIIDFGFSSQFEPEEMPPALPPLPASDNSAPEFKSLSTPCDPFPLDVYYVGNMIRMDFIDGHEDHPTSKGRLGFEFLRPLIEAMTKEDPSKRITMGEALVLFDELVSQLGDWKLRSRQLRAGNTGIEQIRGLAGFWRRRLRYTVTRLPAIPGSS